MTEAGTDSIVLDECNEPLVDLSSYPFILEPMYFKMGFSTTPKMHLRAGVAEKLVVAQQALGGWKLKIWDGWRSREVQWNIYRDYYTRLEMEFPHWTEEALHRQARVFVAPPDDPKVSPPHSTGGAVDLTLCSLDGVDLDMGTPFDFFGSEASPLYYENHSFSKSIRDNRRRLRDVLVDLDFIGDPEEWWDFNYGNKLWASQMKKNSAFYGEVSL